MELQDKVCLITGGTKGIGAATAVVFAQRGAKVAIVGRNLNDEEAIDTKKKLEATGRPFLVIPGDIGSAEECKACVEQTRCQFGDVDVLVHSAGGPVPGGIMEIDAATWNKAFDVHVHAVFHLAQAVVPAMKAKKAGVIILVSSVAGIRGLKTNIAYQTVKGTIPQLARGLAYELADDNIRVNSVAPGIIWTDFHKGANPQWRENNLKNRIPLHREGTCEQVASAIRELTENEYVTGENFVVDGGLTMRIC